MKFTTPHLLVAGASALALTAGSAQADQVFVDDVIVQGSLCVGLDCVNGENFGFDTLRLKENNLRINATDTSSSASFPTTDWRIIFNDSSNGGANKFTVEDVTGGRLPFTIEGSAPSNALYVDDGGRIGLGTATPVVEAHIVDGDTPTLRLEQDGSSGFTPQTFDIAANESNFFVRDVTNGSQLPFRIAPGADTNSISIAADNDVGMGVQNPEAGASLHMRRTNGTSKLLVEEASSTAASRELMQLRNNGGSYITISNTASGNDWFFTHENAAAGRFIINNSTLPNEGLFLDPDGDMTIGGTLTENSDKHSKMAIVPVDTAEILDKVSTLPVSTWTYKDDTSGARHVGPMAQDFYAAFGLGATETGIATLDTSGIALASIKALHDENEDLKARIAALEELIQD